MLREAPPREADGNALVHEVPLSDSDDDTVVRRPGGGLFDPSPGGRPFLPDTGPIQRFDQRPRFAEWTRDDAEIWVSSEIGGTVSVIDNATRAIKTKITFEIPGVPREAITVQGFGESRPLVPTGDGVREPLNRRATVDINF